MEFRFDVSKIFKNNISRIGNSLLPAGFAAPDRRCALDATAYVAEIINTIGQASATAQGLSQPVTNSDRLRNSDDQVIYLMTEDNGKNGLVVGLLKIGRKSLYVFDKYGETRHVNAPSVLDFYVHESRQRGGLGKILFEYMLEYENLLPEQMAIDRPSDKLLGFLRKHYALTHKIPQMNNFVIYDGFFAPQSQKEVNGSGQTHITASPNSNLFGAQFMGDEKAKQRSNSRSRQEPPMVQNHVIGRYGARRPQCSLNQIIHNKPTAEPSSQRNGETSPSKSDENVNQNNGDVVDELTQELESLDAKLDEPPASISPVSSSDHVKFADDDRADTLSNGTGYFQHEREYFNETEAARPQHQDYFRGERSTSPFQYNKRKTGKKNVSNIVVGSNDRIDFGQVDDRGFGVSKNNNQSMGMTYSRPYDQQPHDDESIHSRDSGKSHTADGFFDLKFYSHPLW